jgi:hypothetical protein
MSGAALALSVWNYRRESAWRQADQEKENDRGVPKLRIVQTDTIWSPTIEDSPDLYVKVTARNVGQVAVTIKQPARIYVVPAWTDLDALSERRPSLSLGPVIEHGNASDLQNYPVRLEPNDSCDTHISAVSLLDFAGGASYRDENGKRERYVFVGFYEDAIGNVYLSSQPSELPDGWNIED